MIDRLRQNDMSKRAQSKYLTPILFCLALFFSISPVTAGTIDPCRAPTAQDASMVTLTAETLSFEPPGTIASRDGHAFTMKGLILESLLDESLEATRQKAIKNFLSDKSFTLSLHTGKQTKPDRYGRQAAFIAKTPHKEAKSEQGSSDVLLQDLLLSEGLARVDVDGLQAACAHRFLSIEQKARQQERGIWKLKTYRSKSPRDVELGRTISSYQIVIGKPVSISRRPEKTSYLNFGRIWRRDFTITLSKKMLAKWEVSHKSLDDLTDASIYVRGWVEDSGGPMIRIHDPNQLWILDETGNPVF